MFVLYWVDCPLALMSVPCEAMSSTWYCRLKECSLNHLCEALFDWSSANPGRWVIEVPAQRNGIKVDVRVCAPVFVISMSYVFSVTIVFVSLYPYRWLVRLACLSPPFRRFRNLRLKWFRGFRPRVNRRRRPNLRLGNRFLNMVVQRNLIRVA